MNSEILKKVIFFSFLFINFTKPANSSNLQIVNENINDIFVQKDLLKKFKNKKLSKPLFEIKTERFIRKKQLQENNSDLLLADLSKKKMS